MENQTLPKGPCTIPAALKLLNADEILLETTVETPTNPFAYQAIWIHKGRADRFDPIRVAFQKFLRGSG
jgi:hypothetical protein